MADNSSKFFCNKECEYFPCHRTSSPEDFNCLFCYCPLYALGEECGGNFHYTEKGRKSCVDCGIPHTLKGYDFIISQYSKLEELACQK